MKDLIKYINVNDEIKNNLLLQFNNILREGLTEYICPAEIDKNLEFNIMKDTERLFKTLGCEVYSRADYILDKRGHYYFLEMNTLPGMTPTSLLPKSMKCKGMVFEQLIKNIINYSLKCR